MLQHGIQHVLYPTSWFSSLPFYTALQLQQSFSFANNIVLLAAGADSPISGQAGSGIFVGRSGAVAMILPAESTQCVKLSSSQSIKLINLSSADNWFYREFRRMWELTRCTLKTMLWSDTIRSKWMNFLSHTFQYRTPSRCQGNGRSEDFARIKYAVNFPCDITTTTLRRINCSTSTN